MTHSASDREHTIAECDTEETSLKLVLMSRICETVGYEGGTCGASCSLLMPGMDNTRHFYSITAVAGTV